MKYLKIPFLFLSFFLIFLFSSNVFACRCSAKPTVLESFEDSELVIIAKAILVEMKKGANKIDFEAQRKKDGYDGSYRYVKAIKMQIEKVYKGNRKVGDVLTFISGDGVNCGMTFGKDTTGTSFLFYLGDDSPDKIYGVSFCGRSQRIIGYETDDLKYLNNLDKVKGKTRISGDFNCWYYLCPNLANVKIKIIGENETYETTTDENGVYEIYDLPPGKYLLEPQISEGYKIDRFMLSYSPASRETYSIYDREPDLSKQVPIILTANKHTGADFYFEIDTAIRGKVLSPDGTPMEGVCVKAVSTELKEGNYRGRSDCTNKDGIFVVSEIPPGKYILVANDDGKISAEEPFGVLFYGNTTKYGEAKSFEVKLGDHLDGFTIRVPKIEELVTISGKLIYSNGVPVANEWLKFHIDDNIKNIDGEQRISTDNDGNFSFKILKGFKGKLFGSVYFIESMFKNCPQYFAEVRKIKEKRSGDIITSKIPLDATKDVSNLIVKFDFPGCKKV